MKCAEFVGKRACRDAHTHRALQAVMGSWLAGEKVLEVLRPAGSSRQRVGLPHAPAGRQWTRMLEADTESR